MSNAAQQDFDQTYRRLANAGRADEPGGGEYKRVLAEWREAGSPTVGVEAFIRVRANMIPGRTGREQCN